MTKVEIKRLDSVTANDTTATLLINDNFKAIQDALENTLSRDGTTPNFMDANLDLNSYKIINSGEATDDNDVVTLKLVKDTIGTVTESAEAAANSAKQAATSAQSAQVSATNAIIAVRNAEETIVQATELLEETQTYVDNAKVDIDNAVAQGKTDINQYVVDSETEVKQIAVDAATAAIADAAAEATQTATDNLNTYVDGTVKPSLQTYVDQASASASAAAESASNADADADNAAESAGLAATSAEQAHNSEVAAANYLNELKTTATTTFNQNAEAKTTSFNNNATNKQAQVDASAAAAAQSAEEAAASAASLDADTIKRIALEGYRSVDCSGATTAYLQNTDEIIGLKILDNTSITLNTSQLSFSKYVYTVQFYVWFPNGLKTISLSTNLSGGLNYINGLTPNFSSAKGHWLVARTASEWTQLMISDAGVEI